MPDAMIAGRYRLQETLGQGGMGTIYRAHDERLDRAVAVKVVSASDLGSEGRSRLLGEAKLAAQLNHPNIVTVYDAGEAEEGPYIVMELVGGRTIHQDPPDSLDQALQYAAQISSALAHAHANGVVHRDLKPENVIVASDGAAKLMDFGLAQSIASRMTSEGLIVGTVFYIAPEQALGKPIDGRTDLYSLGVMLYEMVTGQLPFEASEPLGVISQHLHAPVVPPTTIRSEIPAPIESLILRLLEKDPANRPAGAAEVERELRRFLEGEPITTPGAALEARLEQLARGRLVGRKRSLDDLMALWRQALDGEAHLALISGEPGVGKTRLAGELTVMAGLQGATVLRGGSYEFEASTPYMPFVEAIRGWVSEAEEAHLERMLGDTAAGIGRLAPEIGTRVGTLEPLPALSANEERLRLFDYVARFFRSLAEEHGLLVLLDDLHWADQGSLQLLHYLLRHLREERVLFLGCYRELELDRAHPLAEALVTWNRERLSTRLALDRFGPEGTRALLETLFQEQISEEFVLAVHRETEGNPFFIEEVVKSLISSGDVYREHGRWQRKELANLALPQSVKEAIGRRLDRLGEYCLEVLHTASALGKSFPFTELRLLYDNEDDLLDALDEARQAQLVEVSGQDSFVFTHDKIREVLYQELNPIRRRRLHQRIGEALEADLGQSPNGQVEDVAYHFIQSGDLERGLRYSLEAAEKAREVFALDAALKLLEAAEESARSLGDHEKLVDVLSLKAEALSLQGHQPQAIRTCQAALELVKDTGRKISLEVDLGAYFIASSDHLARETLQRALEQMGVDADPNLRSHALSLLGRDYHYRAEHRKAIESFQMAKELADPERDPMPLLVAQAFLSGAYQHMLMLEESNAAARGNFELARRYENPFAEAIAHEFLGENATITGDWEAALHHSSEDERIGREMGSRDRIAWARFARAFARYGMGELEVASADARFSLELAEELGELRLATISGYGCAIMLADQGNLGAAREFAQVALERADGFRQPALQAWARLGLAKTHYQENELEHALSVLDDGDAVRRGTDNLWSAINLWPLRADVLLHLGRLNEVEKQLAELFELLESRPGIPAAETIALRLRGALRRERGELEGAAEDLQKSLDLAQSSGSRPEAARAMVEHAELDRKTGSPKQAVEKQQAALEIMRACGMKPEGERLQAQLSA